MPRRESSLIGHDTPSTSQPSVSYLKPLFTCPGQSHVDPAVAYQWSRHVLAAQADRLVLCPESHRRGAGCQHPRELRSRDNPIGQSLLSRCSLPKLGILLYPHGFWPGSIFCDSSQGRCTNRRTRPHRWTALAKERPCSFVEPTTEGRVERRTRPESEERKPGVSTRSSTLSSAHCRPLPKRRRPNRRLVKPARPFNGRSMEKSSPPLAHGQMAWRTRVSLLRCRKILRLHVQKMAR